MTRERGSLVVDTADNISVAEGGLSSVSTIMPIMETAFPGEFGEAWNHNQCRTMLSMPKARLLIAWSGDCACGFAITRRAADEEELLMIAVAPAYRKRGIGRLLLDTVIGRARHDKVKWVFLEVRENNPAQQLYEKAGFLQIGRRPNYYTGTQNKKFDALTFKKEMAT